MIGDIIIVNHKEQTIRIKREKELLNFENFQITNDDIVKIGELEKISVFYDNRTTAKRLLKFILSLVNMTAKLGVGIGNTDEDYWHVERYPEDIPI